ncbi:MAG: tRNA 2-thiouridine(34) synthase MnmA [Anaerolineae bacterium]
MAEESRPRIEDHVVVGLSGGVDSAVAAALLIEQGYTVHGVALLTWKAEGREQDLSGVRDVAAQLGIPLTEKDLREQFYETVVQPFAEAYAEGATPNPCVFCNPDLKFAALVEEANAVEAQWIATGHYARVQHDPEGISHLLRAEARSKDQSYALYRLTQRHLRRLQLPLGDVESKTRVRQLAQRWHLPVAHADDSQDLCFVAAGAHSDLVERLRPGAVRPGPIYDLSGRQLGEHRGLHRYTVGQRSGLGISSDGRLYVLALRPADNALIVGSRSELATQTCLLRAVTFTVGEPPETEFQASGRIRYRAPLTPVTVTLLGKTRARVEFQTPQFGVAPGQSLVIYSGEEVLGGGLIARTPASDVPDIDL